MSKTRNKLEHRDLLYESIVFPTKLLQEGQGQAAQKKTYTKLLAFINSQLRPRLKLAKQKQLFVFQDKTHQQSYLIYADPHRNTIDKVERMFRLRKGDKGKFQLEKYGFQLGAAESSDGAIRTQMQQVWDPFPTSQRQLSRLQKKIDHYAKKKYRDSDSLSKFVQKTTFEPKSRSKWFKAMAGATLFANLLVAAEVLALFLPGGVGIFATFAIVGGILSFFTASVTSRLGKRVDDTLTSRRDRLRNNLEGVKVQAQKVLQGNPESDIRKVHFDGDHKAQARNVVSKVDAHIKQQYDEDALAQRAKRRLHKASKAAVSLDVVAVTAGMLTLFVLHSPIILIAGALAGALSFFASFATLRFGKKTEERLKNHIRETKGCQKEVDALAEGMQTAEEIRTDSATLLQNDNVDNSQSPNTTLNNPIVSNMQFANPSLQPS